MTDQTGSDTDLSTDIGGVTIANPVMTASGTCGTGVELAAAAAAAADVTALGAIVMKTVTREARAGNSPIRLAETPSGMLNSIGLENPGIDEFCSRSLPEARKLGVPLVASIAGRSIEDYAHCAAKLDEAGGMIAIEVNLSCPNDRDASGERHTPLAFGQDAAAASEAVAAVKAVASRPVWAKLTSLTNDIAGVARACAEKGADAIVAINTVPGMAIDIRARRPVLAATTGGLSGPAIRPVALKCAWEIAKAVDVPVIGCGGVESAEDVVAMLLAGASAVQIGTATFRDPASAAKAARSLPALLAELGADSVKSIIGKLEVPHSGA